VRDVPLVYNTNGDVSPPAVHLASTKDLVVRQPSCIIRRMRTQVYRAEPPLDIFAYVTLFWTLDDSNAEADTRSELVYEDV
jgi:hypothetical protein